MSLITLSPNAAGTGTFTIASPNSNTDRTLTLPDASGTVNTSGAANEVPAGSAAAPAIYPTGDTNTGIFFPAADTIAFAEGGVEAMRLDASGNLLVGTTSKFGGGIFGFDVNHSTSPGMTLGVSGVVRGFLFANSGFSTVRLESAPGYTVTAVSGGTGGVSLANGATSWASLSDERTKTELTPITNAAEKVSSLRSVTGRFKTDAPEIRRAFLIAQDVQAVLPEAVTPYQVKDDDTEYLGLAYTDVIPLLVAAIQEQQALINAQQAALQTLTARVEALEGASNGVQA